MFSLSTYPFFFKGWNRKHTFDLFWPYCHVTECLPSLPPSLPFRKKLIKLQTVAFVINMACFHDIFALADQKISE